MPPRLELLFHPKKKAKPQGQRPPSNTPPLNTTRQLSQDKTAENDDDEDLQLPDTPFQEFRLLSSALNGWKYDVMRFDSRKPVDIYRWHQPVKLNRKDLRRNDETSVNDTPLAVGPMLGPDGKPVIGPDGKMVMVDAEGRPIQSANGSMPETVQNKDKGKVPLKKRFQKKTRQVFPVAEGIRQLRKEERYPWVIEDSSPSQNELWTAQMEDLGKAGTHAFFMPAANEVFKFVPSHRWYKFQKKLKHDLPTDLANVESLVLTNLHRLFVVSLIPPIHPV
jgi:transcription initiation factor TFIIF subunit alpha